MSAAVIQQRIKLLQAMHTLILYMNDENAYMEWIYLVPDQPSDEDFLDMAEDTLLYGEACREFRRLVGVYGDSGLYIGGDTAAF